MCIRDRCRDLHSLWEDAFAEWVYKGTSSTGYVFEEEPALNDSSSLVHYANATMTAIAGITQAIAIQKNIAFDEVSEDDGREALSARSLSRWKRLLQEVFSLPLHPDLRKHAMMMGLPT